ncbi:MAG: OprO/OprP family phosphate-selective porin [Pseudomonadales bacterium]
MKQNALKIAVLAAVTTAPAIAGTVTSDGADLVIKTKGGLEVNTVDGDYGVKIGGRIQLDYNTFDGVINEVVDETGSDLFFRRARVEVKGKAKDWGYLVSYNLTDDGSIDQLHASYNGWGEMAALTLGQQKESFGLDDTGSSKWIIGIERSLPSNAFDTGNNIGVRLHGATDLLGYSFGAFKEGTDDDNALELGLTGRFVVRPIYSENTIVHLGVGYTTRDGEFDAIDSRLGVRGDVNKVEAGYDGLTGDEFEAFNLEAAGIFGPLHVMSEYFDGEISGAPGAPEIEANGYYVTAGWVITGEQRGYKTAEGVFDKIKPANPVGAWEVFARYDFLDVSDTAASPQIAIDAGDASTITAGVNWYATNGVKVALNFVHAETDEAIGGEDSGDAIALRMQYLF